MLADDSSRGVRGKGEDERVVGEDVERYAESVKEYSSAAVASREPSSSPLCERFNSCTPTVHPERYVGSE